ncbi:hypothetical protein J6590_001917 [Homalodisca vitripennis]|nr:hypothetical protein J6590_001917 [Homalodisca vitripennis]
MERKLCQMWCGSIVDSAKVAVLPYLYQLSTQQCLLCLCITSPAYSSARLVSVFAQLLYNTQFVVSFNLQHCFGNNTLQTNRGPLNSF